VSPCRFLCETHSSAPLFLLVGAMRGDAADGAAAGAAMGATGGAMGGLGSRIHDR